MRTAQILGIAILLLLSSCGPQVQELPDDQGQSFAEQVEAISENLLVALNNHDEIAYTRDMDTQMKAASSGDRFEEVYQIIIGRLGKYVSRQLVRVEERDQFRAVIYDARFEQENHVTVRVVYNVAGDQPLVSGLWFDSPKLREK